MARAAAIVRMQPRLCECVRLNTARGVRAHIQAAMLCLFGVTLLALLYYDNKKKTKYNLPPIAIGI